MSNYKAVACVQTRAAANDEVAFHDRESGHFCSRRSSNPVLTVTVCHLNLFNLILYSRRL